MKYTVYHIHVDPYLSSGYVGITKNLSLRFAQHGWKRKQTNPHLRAALKKYGDKVQFSVISQELDYETARWIEQTLRPLPNMGWNICKGGDVPPNPKGKTRNAEYRANISKAKQGEKNPMFGKKVIFSESHRKKLSIAMRGKPSQIPKGSIRKQIVCPYCNKVGGEGSMNRWHFDRCKNAS